MGSQIHVCYLINTLAPAGAENLLLDVIRHTPDDVAVTYTVCFMGRDDTLKLEFENAGARVVNFGASVLFPYDPRSLVRMLRFFRRESIDILHAHLPSVHWIGRILGRMAGVEHIVCTHHNLPDNYGAFSRTAERLTRPFDTVTVAVSEGVRAAFGGNDDRWRVIHNGIDVEAFADTVGSLDVNELSDSFNLVDESLVFLNVARYAPQKAQVDLVRAMEEVVEAIPEAVLLLVGWGERENAIVREIQDRSLEEHVFTTGRVPTVHEYYALADVFVLPSRVEGFGIVLLEAMASRLPVVATDIPGVNEVVEDGVTGVLVPPADPGAMAEAMESLRSPERRAHYGSRGRERAAQQFDIGTTVASHVELYREIQR